MCDTTHIANRFIVFIGEYVSKVFIGRYASSLKMKNGQAVSNVVRDTGGN